MTSSSFIKNFYQKNSKAYQMPEIALHQNIDIGIRGRNNFPIT